MHQSSPARVRPPRHRRWFASGKDGERVGTEAGQQILAEPALQRRQQLGSVHQQEQTLESGERSRGFLRGLAARRLGQCREKRGRDRGELTAVETYDVPPDLHAHLLELAEQRGLSDSARTRHEHDRAVVTVPGQVGEQRQLG